MWEIGRTCPLISAIFRDRCDQRGWSRWILGFSSKKGKKKRKKRTYEFVSRILRGKRDDASRWKAIRGTGNVRNWKGKRSREGKVRVRIECRWRRDWLWFMARKCSHRRAHRCPAIRKNLMWRKSGRDPRPMGREILRNSSPPSSPVSDHSSHEWLSPGSPLQS